MKTIVLDELERHMAKIGYVRSPGGFEVDFHARFPDGREELIQDCVDAGSDETMVREIRALTDASGDFPHARWRMLVLTYDHLSVAPVKDLRVNLSMRGR